MVAALYRPVLHPVVRQAARAIPVVLTLAVLSGLLFFLGWSYLAQPKQREGVCYESRGHPMPCFVLEQRRAAKR